MALKKKFFYESQLQQIASNIKRVSEQKAMLESQRTTIETVPALNSAAEASDMDEDDLLAEFEIIEAEQLDAELSEPAFPTKSMYTAR